jgi:thiol-disulfide isomerase/thioredoxin
MKNKNTIYVLFFVAVILFLCLYPNQSTFSEITSPESSKYDSADADGNVLIFYANWCGHCNKAKPEFQKAAEKGNGKIVLIDADDLAAKEIKDKYSVQGFPSIIKVSNRNYVKYQGSRTADDILSFLNNSEN